VFICFLFLLALGVSAASIPCVVESNFDSNWLEFWDFEIPQWAHVIRRYATNATNFPPMTGIWTYEVSFCDYVRLYMGIKNESTPSLGWNFGILTSFLSVPAPNPPPPVLKRFVQTYSGGDCGAPCSTCRSSTVNLYCGNSNSTCRDVPGARGAVCLSGSISEGFCLCAVGFNSSMCDGLWLNILSRNCTGSTLVPMGDNTVSQPPNIAAAVIASLIGVFVACYIGGYIYNYKVHTKRGAEALPFYDTCTGSSKTSYSGISH